MNLFIQFLRLYFLYKRKKERGLPEIKQINKLRSIFYKSVWKEATTALSLNLKKIGNNSYIISNSNKKLWCKNNETNIDGYLPVRLSLDKSFSYSLLSTQNFTVPEYYIVNKENLSKGLSIYNQFKKNSKSVTIKPANGTGAGMGITVDVKDIYIFILAFAYAGTFSDEIIIEETIKGNNYRLLFYETDLLDAVHRRPPSLKGNGQNNILELIKFENDKRLKEPGRAQTLISVDLELKNCLKNQGYKLKSIIQEHKIVFIKNVINDNNKNDNISVMENVPDELVKKCSLISELFNLNIVGVDIIAKDISDISDNKDFYIIEVNANPGFFYHYYKHQNKSSPVANALLKRYFNI